ncbi:DUF4350 domain-containing protein [Nocardioides sp. SYSU DS0651]|uniref:DUF4350 domain-containing protein n=1 Tax=Nocardioides sp. SYSU DS0651 TaxID=3415955 RepID=UPI003F4B1059
MTAGTTPAPAGAIPVDQGERSGPGERWRRLRVRLLLAAAVLLALVAAVWTAGGAESTEPLDPSNPAPDGAQAVAEVLAEEGVDVTVARSADALEDTAVDDGTTVVVTSTHHLSPSTLRRLRDHASPGRLVLVEPSYSLVQEVDGSQTTSSLFGGDLEADCGPVDGIDVDGLSLEVDEATAYAGSGCFAGGAGAVLVADRDADVVLFGAGEALTNDQVLRADNAAVALRLLGEDDRLVWYVPDPADAEADEAVTVGSLLPDWIAPALWMVALAGVGLVLWRFRRLGPLSTEPLPVVVRAVETARSRGRMYRKSGDRGHAAQALRRSAVRALGARLRLDRHADAVTVAEAVARDVGRPPAEIGHLLAGPPPTTDRDLVRLAQELARLRKEVGRG